MGRKQWHPRLEGRWLEGPMSHDDLLWTPLTDEQLSSDGAEYWSWRIGSFEPYEKLPGSDAAQWLLDRIHEGSIPLETHVLHDADGQIQGFLSIRPAEVAIGRRLLGVVDMRRLFRGKPPLSGKRMRGLLIEWIVRSADTPPGFGRELIEYAIALAARDGENAALFVNPHDEAVAEMWKRRHNFREMDAPATAAPNVLWFPVDPPPDVTFQ